MKMNHSTRLLLILFCLVLLPNIAAADLRDYPHNTAETVECVNCHYVHGSQAPPWATHVPLDIDDSTTNNLCWSCHTGLPGDPPVEYTHSSLRTDNGYGDWSIECKTCHDPHRQKQPATYGSASYIETGTSTGLTSTTLTDSTKNWTANQFAGMILMPDSSRVYPNQPLYQIASNTSNTITIDGVMDASLTFPKGYAIYQGKLIKNSINAPNRATCSIVANQYVCSSTTAKTVRFFRESGMNGPADGDSTYDGVCEVCHTQTSFHRNAAAGDHTHNTGSNCFSCHNHEEGFKISGCTSCHGFPPTNLTLVGFTNPSSTGSTIAGAHDKHVNTKSYPCDACHYNSSGTGTTHNNSNVVTLGFNFLGGAQKGGTYNGQSAVTYNTTTTTPPTNVTNTGAKTCTVYCHSTGQSTTDGSVATPTYASPVWDGTVACGSCHDKDIGVIVSGSHNKHLASTLAGASNVVQGCGNCHTGAANNASSYNSTNHVNSSIDVSGTYSAGGAPGNGYGTCTAASCHENGRGTLVTSPTWGTSAAACTGCHIAAPTTGSHTGHISGGANCGNCHNDTVQSVTAPTGDHLDGNIDVKDSVNGDLGYPANKTKNTAFTTCSTASCHANVYGSGTSTTPVWGSSGNGCSACHSTPIAATGPATGSHVLHGQTNCTLCHNAGTTSTTKPSTEHADGDIDTANVGYPDNKTKGSAFTTCSTASCHANVYGSGTSTTPVWGSSGNGCSACHSTAIAVTGPATGGHALHNDTTCTDCHNAGTTSTTKPLTEHADGNIDTANVGYTDEKTKGSAYTTCSTASCHSNVYGSGTSTTPVWGTSGNGCSACHSTAIAATGPATGGHALHAQSDCTLCHNAGTTSTTKPSTEHADGNIDTANVGYTDEKTKGSAFTTCSTASCHANVYGSGTTTTPTWGTTGNGCSACHSTSIDATGPATGSHVAHNQTDCTLCHNAGTTSTTKPSTEHADGNIDTANVGYTDEKTKGSAYTTCSTASCHANVYGSGTTTTPIWGTTGNGCSACHSTSIDATGPATGSHVAHNQTDCTLCHNAGTTSTTKPSTEHADGNIDTANVGYTDEKTKGSAYTTCSTASCHDNGTGTLVTTPVWGTSVTNCSECHATQPTTGSHSAHLSASVKVNGSNIGCGACHNDAVEGTTPPAGHRDGNIDVYDATSGDLGYPENKTKNTAYDSCSTASCHTNGQDSGGASVTQKTTELWGTSAGCATCHDFNGSNQPTSGSHSTHITRTGGSCVECHNVYGDGTSQPDLNSPVHINGTINVAAGGTYTVGGSVSFSYNGSDAHSGNHAPAMGYGTCSTVSCHGGGATRSWGVVGDSCSDCHSSLGGPSGGDSGHGIHVQSAYVGTLSSSDYGNYATNAWYSYSNTGGTPDMGCGFCHPQSDATHNNGTVNLNFSPSDTGAAGTLKAKNNATPSYSQTQRVSVTCSSVYCHSDGAGTYKTSPEWFAGNFVGNKCDDCHGNSPTTNSHAKHVVGIHYLGIYTGSTGLATAGTGNTNSHGSATYSTTINCNACHYNTVTDSINDANAVCLTCHNGTDATSQGEMTIAVASTTHVNGTPDVAFKTVNVKSKAQVRNDITTVTDLNENWSRTSGYKAAGSYDNANNALNTANMYDGTARTCSAVACHNGNSVTWGATGIGCKNCHTGMPK